MLRMACIDLPAFPLQLLLRRETAWGAHPVAVVEQDRPQGRLLWVNERARAARILPGMRYAAALSLAGELRAAEVSEREIGRAVDVITRWLRRFTPEVEPAAGDPGLFWLNAAGLEGLYPSLGAWAEQIRAGFARARLTASVVVGHTLFGTAALAKSALAISPAPPAVALAKAGTVTFFDTSEAERDVAYQVPIDRLSFAPAVRDVLEKLGVRTVGDFAALPAAGIARRLGPEAEHLHRLARGAKGLFQPRAPEPPLEQHMHLDYTERDVTRLMAIVTCMLPRLLKTLVVRGLALTAVQLVFRLERGGTRQESLRPAAPTLEAKPLLELIRLRLDSLRPEMARARDGVTELRLAAEGEPAEADQLELFAEHAHRDREAAARALARVRAVFGNDVVVRARLEEGHLPEAQFAWEPLRTLPVAQPGAVTTRCLVRRIETRPLRLPARSRHEPDGWMLRGLAEGPVVRVHGPYVVSGGWWRKAIHREYHFAETQSGDILWTYYDRVRRRWFLQGRVE